MLVVYRISQDPNSTVSRKKNEEEGTKDEQEGRKQATVTIQKRSSLQALFTKSLSVMLSESLSFQCVVGVVVKTQNDETHWTDRATRRLSACVIAASPTRPRVRFEHLASWANQLPS